MKKIVKHISSAIINTIGLTKAGMILLDGITSEMMRRKISVNHDGAILSIPTPNLLCFTRAKTFSSKEPETLEWIDSIPEGSVIWDVGANIGLYSVYASKTRNCRVWAFEPSVFNLEILARNIFTNNLTQMICIVPLALSEKKGANCMQLTTTDWGGALSTFGESFGWDGKPLEKVFEYKTLGISMDDAISNLRIPNPDYIKMDVDGIEHIILKGGADVLKKTKGILIEVNDSFLDQAENCNKILIESGFILKEKRHSEMFENSKAGFNNSYNQIWFR